MTTLGLLLVAVAILGYGLVSARAQRSILTPPIVFVGLGCLVSQHGLGWVEFHLDRELQHTLLEVALLLVLFSDAARIDLRQLRREHDLPARLLAIGLPLTLVCGSVVGLLLFPDMGLWHVALLAAILAPTDAALGQAVVSSPQVPVRIRQTLNVESGLNDGLALPAVLVLLSLAEASEGQPLAAWVRFALLQVTLGPLVGGAVGYLGGRLVDRAVVSGWMSDVFRALSAVGLALLAFSVAELVHGNGFIAAFCAGLVLGNTSREVCSLEEFAEEEGQLLTLLVFVMFGGLMVAEGFALWSGRTVLYALLSLTVVRMLPVSVSLLGKGLAWETHLFLGWFGPRGVASILFSLLVVDEAGLAEFEALQGVVTLVVLASIVLHGISAAPASAWYARRTSGMAAEQTPVEEMPLRTGSPSSGGSRS